MATDFLLKITGIDGESSDKDYPKSIQLKGWTYGLSSPIDPVTRQKTGQVQVADLVVTKTIDVSTVALTEKLLRNATLESVKLIARKQGEGQKPYFILELKKARVRSITVKGGEPDATIPLEVIAFTFMHIDWMYKPQDNKGGLGGEVRTEHDIARNV